MTMLMTVLLVLQDTGSVSGKATLEGRAPKPKKLLMSDPFCLGCWRDETPLSESIVVRQVDGENRLQWMVVQVSSNVEGKFEAPRGAVEINQFRCRYEPHVAIAMKGQLVRFKNDDDTMHAVVATFARNPNINAAIAKKGGSIERVLANAEPDAVAVTCGPHPWMLCWLWILDHPYFALTDENGNYEIKGLPAGEHELTFWHEKLGEKKVRVKIEAGKTATRDITFEQP